MALARLVLLLLSPFAAPASDPESAPPDREPMIYAVRTASDLGDTVARLDALNRLGVSVIAVDPRAGADISAVLALTRAARSEGVRVLVRHVAEPDPGRSALAVRGTEREAAFRVVQVLSPGSAVLTPADLDDPLILALAGVRRQLVTGQRLLPSGGPGVVVFERLSRGRRLIVAVGAGLNGERICGLGDSGVVQSVVEGAGYCVWWVE